MVSVLSSQRSSAWPPGGSASRRAPGPAAISQGYSSAAASSPTETYYSPPAAAAAAADADADLKYNETLHQFPVNLYPQPYCYIIPVDEQWLQMIIEEK